MLLKHAKSRKPSMPSNCFATLKTSTFDGLWNIPDYNQKWIQSGFTRFYGILITIILQRSKQISWWYSSSYQFKNCYRLYGFILLRTKQHPKHSIALWKGYFLFPLSGYAPAAIWQEGKPVSFTWTWRRRWQFESFWTVLY